MQRRRQRQIVYILCVVLRKSAEVNVTVPRDVAEQEVGAERVFAVGLPVDDQDCLHPVPEDVDAVPAPVVDAVADLDVYAAVALVNDIQDEFDVPVMNRNLDEIVRSAVVDVHKQRVALLCRFELERKGSIDAGVPFWETGVGASPIQVNGRR